MSFPDSIRSLPGITGRPGMRLKKPQNPVIGTIGTRVLLGNPEKIDPALSKSSSFDAKLDPSAQPACHKQ